MWRRTEEFRSLRRISRAKSHQLFECRRLRPQGYKNERDTMGRRKSFLRALKNCPRCGLRVRKDVFDAHKAECVGPSMANDASKRSRFLKGEGSSQRRVVATHEQIERITTKEHFGSPWHLPCLRCGATFTTQTALSEHQRKAHPSSGAKNSTSAKSKPKNVWVCVVQGGSPGLGRKS